MYRQSLAVRTLGRAKVWGIPRKTGDRGRHWEEMREEKDVNVSGTPPVAYVMQQCNDAGLDTVRVRVRECVCHVRVRVRA